MGNHTFPGFIIRNYLQCACNIKPRFLEEEKEKHAINYSSNEVLNVTLTWYFPCTDRDLEINCSPHFHMSQRTTKPTIRPVRQAKYQPGHPPSLIIAVLFSLKIIFSESSLSARRKFGSLATMYMYPFSAQRKL